MSLMTIEPCSGLSSPIRDLRNTDLPVPEGPSRTEISPGGSVRVTSLQMFWLPNDLVSPSTSTATPTCRSAPPLRLLCRFPAPPHRRAPAVCDTCRPARIWTTVGPLLLVSNDSAGAQVTCVTEFP